LSLNENLTKFIDTLSERNNEIGILKKKLDMNEQLRHEIVQQNEDELSKADKILQEKINVINELKDKCNKLKDECNKLNDYQVNNYFFLLNKFF
jgi:DNA-binding ferritin-like protein